MRQILEEQLWELRRSAGEDAMTYAYVTETEWVCVCGARNPLDEREEIQTCSACDRNRDSVLEHYTEEEMIPIPSDPDVAISSGESSVEGASPMKVAGAMLLIAGLALTGAQLFIKEDIGFGLRVNVLPESYLYVGLVGAIIGALLIVGDRIRATSTAPSPMPPRAGVSPQGSPFVESEEREGGIPLQIEHLARLRDQGILSEEEFEQKKKELLARM